MQFPSCTLAQCSGSAYLVSRVICTLTDLRATCQQVTEIHPELWAISKVLCVTRNGASRNVFFPISSDSRPIPTLSFSISGSESHLTLLTAVTLI